MYTRGAVKKLLNWPFFSGKIYRDKRKPPQASRRDQDTENIRAREAQEQERRVQIARDTEWQDSKSKRENREKAREQEDKKVKIMEFKKGEQLGAGQNQEARVHCKMYKKAKELSVMKQNQRGEGNHTNLTPLIQTNRVRQWSVVSVRVTKQCIVFCVCKGQTLRKLVFFLDWL